MTKQVVKALRCKNYKEHLIEIDKHPDRQSAPLFIRSNMAIAYGWKKIDGEWLCSACVDELDE